MSPQQQHGLSPPNGATPGAATPGLRLDARQRAMLAEMKIPLWWPEGVVKSPPAAAADRALASDAAVAMPPTRPPEPAARLQAQARTPAARPLTDRAAVAASSVSDAGPEVAAMDWAQLYTAVQACTACGRCTGRKAPVFVAEPQPRQADWLVVGEPPDDDEERAGTPFVGNTGQLLDNMLRAVRVGRDGQGRAGARLTPVVKCRPAAVHNPTPDELAQCAVFLRREIALTRPRVIVAMGRFAALSLLAADHPELLQLPFGQMRGTVYRSMGVPVVVTYHPSKLLRAPEHKAHAWADLCLAQAQAAMPSSSSA